MSALLNGRGHLMVEKIAARLPPQDEQTLHPEERPGDAGDAEVVVIGMVRLGLAAYQRLTDHYGLRVIGVDYDGFRVSRLKDNGLRVIEGDATDLDFWNRLRRSGVRPDRRSGHAASRRERHRAGMPARIGVQRRRCRCRPVRRRGAVGQGPRRPHRLQRLRGSGVGTCRPGSRRTPPCVADEPDEAGIHPAEEGRS